MQKLQNNCKIPLKYKGGALVYAVAVLIIITFFSLLLLSYFGINTKLINNVKKDAVNAQYLYSAMARIQGIGTSQQPEYEIPLDDGRKILLAKKKWGVYDCCNAILLSGKDTIAACAALLGKAKNTDDSTALLIYNNTVKLHVGSNVVVVGKVFAPSAIILKYQGYNRKEDINRVFKSPDSTISVHYIGTLVKQLSNLMSQRHDQAKKYVTGFISNSFLSPTQFITADTIYVSGKLSGNIVLTASYISVEDSASIQDAILVASKIKLLQGFSGCLQAFASDSIILEKNVELLYPSSVVLMPELKPLAYWKQRLLPAIVIKDSVSVTGTLYAYLSSNYDIIEKPFISTGPGFNIKGGMYSSGAIDIRGRCSGTVICNRIVQRKLAEDNLLLDTEINIDSLPSYFSYDALFPISGSKKIVKWIKKI